MSALRDEVNLYYNNLLALEQIDHSEIESIIKEARKEADKKYNDLCKNDETIKKIAACRIKIDELQSKIKAAKEESSALQLKQDEAPEKIFRLVEEAVTEARMSKNIDNSKMNQAVDLLNKKREWELQSKKIDDSQYGLISNLKKELKSEQQKAKKYEEQSVAKNTNPKEINLIECVSGEKKKKLSAYIEALPKAWINNIWFPYSQNYNKLRKLVALTSKYVLDVDILQIFREENDAVTIPYATAKAISEVLGVQSDDLIELEKKFKEFGELFDDILDKNREVANANGTTYFSIYYVDSCIYYPDDNFGIKLLNEDKPTGFETEKDQFKMLTLDMDYAKRIVNAVNENPNAGIIDIALKLVGKSKSLERFRKYIVE